MTRMYMPEDPIKSLRILVVEDQQQTRVWIADVLKQMGVREVQTANDGSEALDIVHRDPAGVDLIICDWAMPRMNGMDLLASVRNLRPNLPFIMETGHGTKDHVLAARAQGVDAFIVKPYSAAQLEVRIRTLAKNIRPRAGGSL
ncbi:response regulator [Niveispirillum sp. KHB5.9]|uniref:response regulator n=1 Tax=Niveispirillum sp. KHB5.9 TaxID=3400269 RepID=UPI003A8AA2F1